MVQYVVPRPTYKLDYKHLKTIDISWYIYHKSEFLEL